MQPGISTVLRYVSAVVDPPLPQICKARPRTGHEGLEPFEQTAEGWLAGGEGIGAGVVRESGIAVLVKISGYGQ